MVKLNIETVSWMYLAKKGPDLVSSRDLGGNTVFHHAVGHGNLHMAKWIADTIDGAVDSLANRSGMSPLMSALHENDLPMARWLLDRRANRARGDDVVDQATGETGIFHAARHHLIDLFVNLVDEAYADVGWMDHEGTTV
jgi:ankyrin repeat protein